MPWMPDKAPLTKAADGVDGRPAAIASTESGVKAVERRILSSTEHLNGILDLLAVLTVSLRDPQC